MKPMKAMIFAAGLGTRLKPFTDLHPKALAPINGKPILQLIIEKFKKMGITDIVINVHHFSEQIIDFLKENNNFGITIRISDESNQLLDTGGGIVHARKWLEGNEHIILHNADILTNCDLSEMIKSHFEQGNDVSLLVSSRDSSRYFLFDNNLQMRGWTNTKTQEIKPADLANIDNLKPLAFSGIHVISPRILDTLSGFSTSPIFSITDFYIKECAKLNIKGYISGSSYYWFDIGTNEKLSRAEKYMQNIL
jgi:NDP-sugar pyrophosphorylase family protein